MVEELLAFNTKFVEEKQYEQYATSKYPDKKIAILSCMDTRLTELLPAALGLKNGDVKIIKNAGATITQPFGSAVRSLLIAIYELGVEEILIIGHTDCGVQHMDSQALIEKMKQKGIAQQTLDMICLLYTSLFVAVSMWFAMVIVKMAHSDMYVRIVASPS